MRRTPVHKPVDFRLMIPQKVGVLYVDSQGPVPLSVTVSICDNVNSAKGDDLKQIVRLPALNSTESRVAVSSLLETMTETMVRTPTASVSRCQRDGLLLLFANI